MNNNVANDFNGLPVVTYPAPLTRGLLQLYSVISWSVPNFTDLITYFTGGGLTIKGEQLDWKLGNKMGNTALFGLYLKYLAMSKLPLDQFYALPPIHFVDEVFKNLI